MPAASNLPCLIHELCTACDRMDRTANQQLEEKATRVSKALGCAVDEVHASPKALAYRARVDMKVGLDGKLGYYRPRTHEHVTVPECVIARPELNEVIGRLPTLHGLSALELRSDGEKVVLHAKLGSRRTQTSPAGKGATGRRGSNSSQSKKGLIRQIKTLFGTPGRLQDLGVSGVAVQGKPVLGDCTIQVAAGGVTHGVSPGSFYQVNLEVNDRLVERVGRATRQYSPTVVLDLYAGIGNLSLPLAKSGVAVTQLEIAGSSTRDAERTTVREGLNVTICNDDAGRFQAGDHFFDVAILDPPRAGAPGVLEQLILTRPRALLYVSCDPKSLARDLRRIQGKGYRIASLEIFDMFPQTSHVETLCILERSN